ncbi:hypothetical protein FF38_04758, partial [Lucilia cuprina]
TVEKTIVQSLHYKQVDSTDYRPEYRQLYGPDDNLEYRNDFCPNLFLKRKICGLRTSRVPNNHQFNAHTVTHTPQTQIKQKKQATTSKCNCNNYSDNTYIIPYIREVLKTFVYYYLDRKSRNQQPAKAMDDGAKGIGH